MKSLYKSFISVASFFVLLACGNETSSTGEPRMAMDMAVPRMMPVEEMSASVTEQAPMSEMKRQVVTTGSLHFRSTDIQTDDQKIRSILPEFKAYVQNENQSNSPQRLDYSMTVRVPSENYEGLLDSIITMPIELEHKSSNLDDVTERYYDLKTRIANKEMLEDRYLALLKKATAIKDLLEIERNLNDVRTEIERMQGQLNLLNNQISMSTLHISFYQELPYEYRTSGRKGFFARILGAMDEGWQGFLSFLVIIFGLWPMWLIVGFVIFFVRRFRWRKR